MDSRSLIVIKENQILVNISRASRLRMYANVEKVILMFTLTMIYEHKKKCHCE